MRLSAIVTALFASAVLASDEEAHLERRAAATCGTVSYSASAVTAASQRACSNAASGNTPGGYPHQFNNREGFVFATSGPYLEFPIMKSGSIYTGGSPGPDRVIITKSGCKEAGLITHTGAQGNAFVTCK
ncbi:Ribonuclease/ribotoxin [Microdochium trichocladiopsis]|uniref:ribonuclease T1 n=1 Tax=Microdochium trichocladiopsis TaxID=1682393 RepID=A0A9P8XUJ8_9PEZI|nr:Ribonuclease/ribotoxin [Microdochium trichocladiopsis]KAH7018176.1 Ribonuclease/ribotoxin [Microdochium trichocladiopsis]